MAETLLVFARSPSSIDFSALDASVSLNAEVKDTPSIRRSVGRFFLRTGLPEGLGFYDGIGVFGDELRLTGEMPKEDNGRGNYIFVSESSEGDITIGVDPLGMYPAFYYLDDDVLIASNNVYFVVEALRRLGKPPKKHLALYGLFVSWGTGVNGRTGFDGVRVLTLGERLCIDPRNMVTIQRKPLCEVMYSDKPYETLMAEAAEEILQNIRALASGRFSHLAADLSGGMDSRLVVAAILHERLHEDVLFNTINEYPNADANTAALIRERFGLRLGVSLHPAAVEPHTRFGLMRRALCRVGGLMELYSPVAWNEQEVGVGTMVLGGGLGELMREFYAPKNKASASHPPTYVSQLSGMRNKAGLLRHFGC